MDKVSHKPNTAQKLGHIEASQYHNMKRIHWKKSMAYKSKGKGKGNKIIKKEK